MLLQTRKGDIVNLQNTFCIKVQPERHAKSSLYCEVIAQSPGTKNAELVERLVTVNKQTLFRGSNLDCVAYHEWLKQELQVPRSVIRNTFVAPTDNPDNGWAPRPTDNVPEKGEWVYIRLKEKNLIGYAEFRQVLDGQYLVQGRYGNECYTPLDSLLIQTDKAESNGEAPPEQIDPNNEQFAVMFIETQHGDIVNLQNVFRIELDRAGTSRPPLLQGNRRITRDKRRFLHKDRPSREKRNV